MSSRSPAPRPESAAPLLRPPIILPAITMRSVLRWTSPTRVGAALPTTATPPSACRQPSPSGSSHRDRTPGRCAHATPPTELGVLS